MKKLSDFIVQRRVFVFIAFLILVFLSFLSASKVEINRDITKYLPNSSKVRIGMNIMENEFQNQTSSLNVMFKGLTLQDRKQIFNELKNFDHVKEVLYEENTNYVKKDYTLYKITCDKNKESKEAEKLYDDIIKTYKHYKLETSGDLSDEYKVVLPLWIVVLAIACALIILIIMCDSYVEPFLFLIAIGMGVFLNKGTNIIFASISSITESISAILQLALSMDYSIMLMNRYRQEKEVETDNVKAMKKALYKSFRSISSSSITTIVGLLALIFMSFTIGRDLGFVLAKGVLFSLLTIFTCLPFLILTFDKLITKTRKKAPVFNMESSGKFAYKFRYIGIFVFIIIFVVSFLLKGNLKILYTDSYSDEISKIFNMNNQMAIIYENKYEDEITKYCQTLAKDKKIDEVLCYGNTINEPLLYSNFNSKLKDLKIDDKIDEYLLKIIYYSYYNRDTLNKMTINDLVTFTVNDVYNNVDLNDKISNDTRNNIERLSNFTDTNKVNVKRDTKEIANMFEIDESTVKDLLIYYNSITNNTKLTIVDFVNFMNNYVLKSKYVSNIDNKSLANLQFITTFTNRNFLATSIPSSEMAQLFNVDNQLMTQLYLYYVTVNDINNKLTINDFTNFVINNLLNNEEYQHLFNDDTKEKLNLLNKFSDVDNINKDLNYKEMAGFLNISEDVAFKVYLLNNSQTDNGTKYTIEKLLTNITYISELYPALSIDISQLDSIPPVLYDKELTATEFAEISKIDINRVYLLYSLIDYLDGNTSWLLNPQEFVTFIINNSNNPYLASYLTEDILNNLRSIQYIMANCYKEYSYQELATSFKLEITTLKNIYSLYIINNTEIKISPLDFISFLNIHQNDDILAQNMSFSTIENIKNINNIVDGIITSKQYTKEELARVFNLDDSNISLLYSLYDLNYNGTNITVSYKEFIDFLVNNVISNEKYKNYLDATKIEKINTVNKIINSTINNIKYNEKEMYDIFHVLADDVDQDLVELLYIYYGSKNEYHDWMLTIEQVVNYLNSDILNDSKFNDFIDEEDRANIIDYQAKIKDAKEMLKGHKYSRMVLNTHYDLEDKMAFEFMDNVTKDLNIDGNEIYLIGNTPMAYEMNKSFNSELNFITILTILFIFVIVLITFKSFLIPVVLVVLIQTAVFMTMGILTFEGGTVYFIALLIVQSILMGATIDYAILYTSYYLELRKKYSIKESIIKAYNNSINTILTSALILSIVTLIIGHFSSATASKICITISQGTICSTLLILLLLPELIASFDKFITKNKLVKNKE